MYHSERVVCIVNNKFPIAVLASTLLRELSACGASKDQQSGCLISLTRRESLKYKRQSGLQMQSKGEGEFITTRQIYLIQGNILMLIHPQKRQQRGEVYRANTVTLTHSINSFKLFILFLKLSNKINFTIFPFLQQICLFCNSGRARKSNR